MYVLRIRYLVLLELIMIENLWLFKLRLVIL